MPPARQDDQQEIDELVKLSLTDRVTFWMFDSFHRFLVWRGAVGFYGLFILTFLLGVTAYQLVPGKEWVKTGWPDWAYYTVIGGLGAVLGLLGSQRRWLGAICGAIAGCAMLWAYSCALEVLPKWLPDRVASFVGVAAIGLGFIPTVALYGLVNAVLPKLPEPPPEPEPARCPNPKCLSKKGWNGSVCAFCGTKAEPPTTSELGASAATPL